MSYVLRSKEDLEKHVAIMVRAHSENLLRWADDAVKFFKGGFQMLHDGIITEEELIAKGESVYGQLYAALNVVEKVQAELQPLIDAIQQQREMS